METVCQICSNKAGNHIFTAREMMLGFRDEFEYFACSQCGCLQIGKIPTNLSRYYPKEYYSFKRLEEGTGWIECLKNYFRRKLMEHFLGNSTLVGKILSMSYSNPFPWMKQRQIDFNSRILEVGSGNGKLLVTLSHYGFKKLTGIDLYIDESISYSCGVTIHKKRLEDLQDSFNFIMLHHSFEHMPEPLQVLMKLKALLRPAGKILIRIPILGFAWRKYGANWVQLDPPRHLFLHSVSSFQLLAGKAGFIVEEVEFDSNEFQFWGSEGYLKGIPLIYQKMDIRNSQIGDFRREAMHLNKIADGDSACFYLRKCE